MIASGVLLIVVLEKLCEDHIFFCFLNIIKHFMNHSAKETSYTFSNYYPLLSFSSQYLSQPFEYTSDIQESLRPHSPPGARVRALQVRLCF